MAKEQAEKKDILAEETLKITNFYVSDYKGRMIAEYSDLAIKARKLQNMLAKYKAGTLNFKPNCSFDLLKEQLSAMASYLFILEVRAEIEHINLAEEMPKYLDHKNSLVMTWEKEEDK